MRRIAFAALLCIACSESVQPPKGPPIPSWALDAFGADVEWALDDAVGGLPMIPGLDANNIYVRRGGIFTNSLVLSEQIWALDIGSGTKRWSNSLVTSANVALAGGWTGAIWGSLYMFRSSDGLAKPPFTPSGTTAFGDVSSDGERFFVLTHNTGHVIAFDPNANGIAWEADIHEGIDVHGSGSVVSGNRLIVVFRKFKTLQVSVDTTFVASLDRATGAVQWRVAIGQPGTGGFFSYQQPVADADKVYIVSSQHQVLALSLSSGSVVWHFDAAFGEPTVASDGLALCDGRVVTTTGGMGLVGIDAATGSQLWHFPSGRDFGGTLFDVQCLHGTVLTATATLNVFDAATGTRILGPLPGRVLTSPVYTYGVTRNADALFVVTDRGFVRMKAP